MKKPNVMKIFNTVKKAVEKKSPEILIAFGIAGMITTTVLAVKATPKAMEKIKEVEKIRRQQIQYNNRQFKSLLYMQKKTQNGFKRSVWRLQ